MAVHKQLKVIQTDNPRFKQRQPYESVELFNADGSPLSIPTGGLEIPENSYAYSDELIRPMTGAGDVPLEFTYAEAPDWLDEDGTILETGLYQISMFIINATPATDPGHYAAGILPIGPCFLIPLDAVEEIAGSTSIGGNCVVSVGEDVIPYAVAVGLDSTHNDDTADLTVQVQVKKLL